MLDWLSPTLLSSALLIGLMGGLHCVAMCGGIMSALNLSTVRLQTKRSLAIQQSFHHLGRLLSYASLGALAGGLSQATLWFDSILPVQKALFALSNILLLSLAFAMLRGQPELPSVEKLGARLFRHIPIRIKPHRHPVLIGMGWGFIPCAMVYSVLSLALFSGSALNGALVMAAFWLGTLPNLFTAGWFAGHIIRKPWTRWLAATLLFCFGINGLYHLFGNKIDWGLTQICSVYLP